MERPYLRLKKKVFKRKGNLAKGKFKLSKNLHFEE